MSWTEITIGDLVKLQRGHDLTEPQRKPGDVPVIGSAGPNGTHDKARQVGPSFTVGRSGASIGKVTYIGVDYWPHNTCLYAKDLKGNDARFLAYFLSIQNLAQLNSGAAQPSLNRNFVHAQKVLAPDVQTQRRIASVLSAYDDLIENNRRRIGLFEEAARLLYREWFVHFRFPGHEHVKIVDGVPEGWERTTFGNLFDFPGGFAFKSSTYTDEGKFGVVTIKNVHDAKFVPECPSRVDEIPQKMKEKCRLATGDILLSLTGNVGRACVVFGENYLLNQRVAKICGKDGVSNQFAYWTFSNPDTQKKLENLSHGVAQLNLSPVDLSKRPFVRPEQSLMDDFTETTEPIFEQLIRLNLYNQELIRARDLLLPRLMDSRLEI